MGGKTHLGHPCTGLDFSPDMLAEARRKAGERGVAVEWVPGDMRVFDLGRTFDFVFVAATPCCICTRPRIW